MKVLVACERSGVVRSAFRALGHDAWSNDLFPADDGSPFHIQGDAVEAAYRGLVTNSGSGSGLHPEFVTSPWDLIIAHPECTYLANSGAKHLYAGMKAENGPEADRWAKMGAAAQFFLALLNAPAPMVAVENPVMLGHPKRLFCVSACKIDPVMGVIGV